MKSFPKLTRRAQLLTGAAALALVVIPVACKESTAATKKVATTNVTAPVTTSTVAAVSGKTFTFPSGGGALSPALANQTVSLTLTTTGSTTTAVIGTPGGNIPATVTFGS